jgi:hypothetical protein
LSFTLILYINVFVPRICWLILYYNHCSLVFCVTIKGSLNISLHFVSSKPKANYIFTVNTPILYLSCKKICQKKCCSI